MNRNQVTQNWNQNQSTTTGQGQTQGQGQSQGQRSYTIFAPSNDAYNSLSETQRNEMMDPQNRDRNIASINYLMVEERMTEDQLRQQIQNSNGNYTISTMQGEDITASLEGDIIVLRDGAGNQARITESDTEAADGVVYTIDKVLMPQNPDTNRATGGTMNNTTGTNNTNLETNNQ